MLGAKLRRVRAERRREPCETSREGLARADAAKQKACLTRRRITCPSMQTRAVSIGQPALSLAITFLLIGLTFAVPVQLLPTAQVSGISTSMGNEVGNVYAVVAWTGLAHFFYSYRGQVLGWNRVAPRRIGAYILLAIASLGLLFGARSLLGVGLFGAITWTYFIFHFHRAEVHFEGGPAPPHSHGPVMVIASFAWLSVVLLNPGNVIGTPWMIWLFSLGLGCLVLADNGLTRLMQGDVRNTLLSLFFIAESLVWGTYGRYGGTDFLFGVYVFHIAAGSYFHYLGSYFAGFALTHGQDRWLSLGRVMLVNAGLIAVGVLVVRTDSLRWLRPIFGVEWFTFWVAAHLVMSDVFPPLKRRFAGLASRR